MNFLFTVGLLTRKLTTQVQNIRKCIQRHLSVSLELGKSLEESSLLTLQIESGKTIRSGFSSANKLVLSLLESVFMCMCVHAYIHTGTISHHSVVYCRWCFNQSIMFCLQ